MFWMEIDHHFLCLKTYFISKSGKIATKTCCAKESHFFWEPQPNSCQKIPYNKLPWMRSSTFWLSSSSNSISDSIEESVLAPSSSSESSKTTAVSLMMGRGSSIKRKTNYYIYFFIVANVQVIKIGRNWKSLYKIVSIRNANM